MLTRRGSRNLPAGFVVALGTFGLGVGAALLQGCGGGGGGGGGVGKTSDTFFLTDVKYGRRIVENTGERLVSPLSTVLVDPVTGAVVPGSLQPLASSVDLNALQSLGLGTDYLPRTVPRNAVVQLEFTAAINPASVYGDTIDASGNVLTPGTIQIRTQDGKGIPAEIRLVNSTTVWINPVTAASIGFPPSPIDFGPSGEPRADATGFLKLVLPRKNTPTLVSAAGATIGVRDDNLGDTTTPIGFNPGNRVLDFIADNQLIPTNETFNGFLPDQHAPRIVRSYTDGKVLSFGAGDGGSSTSLTDATASWSTLARDGLGEWADALLTLRPGQADEEKRFVVSNTSQTVTVSAVFTVPPADGDSYVLARAEFFEPDLADPIDDALFDPNNPQNGNNNQISNFIEVYEIDGSGNPVSGPLSIRNPIPAFSELRIRFGEAMAADSFGPWESFRVAFNPDGGTNAELLTQVVLDTAQTTATIRPAREDQQAGTFEIVGWGKNLKALQFILTTVPKPSYLQQFLGSDEVTAFLDQGIRGITDLGGQPLDFPDSLFDPVNPAIRFAVPFDSDETASTQNPPPLVQSWGVMVHRMQGRPVTGIDPATGEPGVGYKDQVNYYRPIADVNLQANGFLAGSPVVYVTKVHDDYFPPPYGQFGKFPFGSSTPLATYNPTAGPQPHEGARFQHVYRDIDCSPSRDALQGTLLDLYRVSWSPIGGNVTSDTYDDISIHAAHSSFRPITAQDGAGAREPYSGLCQPFDLNAWVSIVDPTITDQCPNTCNVSEGPNYWDTLHTCVLPGTTYKISQSNLFAPPFDGNAYHAWPSFDVRFQYNNGGIPQAEKDLRKAMNDAYDCNGAGTVWFDKRKYDANPDLDNLGGDSLMLEYRIRPQTTQISRTNGFTLSLGILLAQLPNFRIWSVGQPDNTVNPDDPLNDQNARCALGVKGGGPSPNPIGDNSRYFAVFDYVKTTSIILSPWVRVFPTDAAAPDYFPVVLQPDLADQPAGTSVTLEFQGATNTKGAAGTAYSTDINVADTKPNVGFRATLVGNIDSLLLPNFDLVAVPYLRPSGN